MLGTVSNLATILTLPTAAAAEPDPDEELATVVLLERARHLRKSAGAVHPLVASAYRRRAAELSVAAWIGAIRAGAQAPPIDAA
jgi:hypothetical protein